MFEIDNPSPAPAYRLVVDGADITGLIDGRLISLNLTDNGGMEADQLDIVLDDADGRLSLPPRGAEIRLAFGWEDEGLVDKGSYTVDEVRHNGAPDRLTIRARSADLRAGFSTQRERSWHGTTVGAIVENIAVNNGLVPLISPLLHGEAIDHLDQTNESDANLLTRLGKLFDAMCTVKAGRLLFLPFGGMVTASGKPLGRVTIERQDGDSHDFSIADRHTYTHVKALYNDLSAGTKGEVIWSAEDDAAETSGKAMPAPEAVIAEAAATAAKPWYALTKAQPTRTRAARVARREWKKLSKVKAQRDRYRGVSVPYHDTIFGLDGVQTYGAVDEEKTRRKNRKAIERQAARDAEKIRQDESIVALGSSAENIKTLRHVYASQTNAKRGARSEWRRLQRGMAEFSITLARGRPELIPELPITVSGFKAEIDNTDWLSARVTHNITDSGFTTSAELEIKATELPG